MIRQTLRGILQVFGGLGAGFAIVFAYAAWQLSSGPISLGFLNEYVENSLSPSDGSFKINLTDTVLTWAGWQRNLDIRVTGVSIVGKNGKTIATVPELSLSVSADALLEKKLAPRTIELFGPKLHLIRQVDGRVEVGFGEAENSQLASSGDPDKFISNFLRRLQQAPDTSRPWSYLRRVSISHASVEVRDLKSKVTWLAPGSEVYIERNLDGLSGEASLNVQVAGESFSITLLGSYLSDKERFDFGIDFDGANPTFFSKLFENVDPLETLDMSLQGTIAGSVGLDWNFQAITFDISGKKGVIKLPQPVEQNIPTKELVIVGTIDKEHQEVSISKLSAVFEEGATFTVPEPIQHTWSISSIEGKGRFKQNITGHLELDKINIDLGGPVASISTRLDGIGGDMIIEGRGKLTDVSIDEVKKYWPKSMGTDAWNWVTKNLSKGKVPEADVQLTARVSAEGKSKVVSLKGGMALENVTVDYLSPMPKATGVYGYAKFDTDKFDITVDKGMAAGLTLEKGFVGLSGMEKIDQYADIKLSITGPLENALGLVDSKPLGYATALGINPKKTKGKSSTELKLDFIMEKTLTFDGVAVRAKSILQDVHINDAFLGLNISNGRLDLDVDKKSMKIGGVSQFGTIPITLVWEEFFSKDAPYRSRNSIHGTVTDDQLVKELGLDFPPFTGGYLSGVTAASLVAIKDHKGKTDLDIHLDLTEAKLALPLFDWQKTQGEPGQARVSLEAKDRKILGIKDFNVEAAGLKASGAITLNKEKQGLKAIRVDRLTHGRTDIRGSVIPVGEKGWDIDLHGAGFDLSPIRESLFTSDSHPGKTPEEGIPPVTLSFSIGKVWLGKDRIINQATGAFSYDGTIWRSAILDGLVADNKSVRLHIEPEGKGRSLFVTSDDAGESLRVLDLMENMKGGRLELSGYFDDSVMGSPLKGNLSVSDFRVVEAPILAHIVSIMALTGILEALGGEGIAFNTLTAPFSYYQGILDLKDAKANGLSLGMTASGKVYTDAEFIDLKGTIVPAYVFNSILGKIPLLGGLFTGGEKGGGIFAANYNVTGPLNEPTTKVDTLTALAPSFLRNLFKGSEVLPPDQGNEFTLPDFMSLPDSDSGKDNNVRAN
ncbi:MAG: DUF3971 domain-containing protein [Rhodospirillales bacterium]|nr:DUF3971 domain-containing protein [Rhodospirillales bacterium]